MIQCGSQAMRVDGWDGFRLGGRNDATLTWIYFAGEGLTLVPAITSRGTRGGIRFCGDAESRLIGVMRFFSD